MLDAVQRDLPPCDRRTRLPTWGAVRARDRPNGTAFVDAIAFYRAQEFARWWPINIAELRFLQREICGSLNLRPGRITTIAGDARTISLSPTQVAMPIIDRWIDQAPERLHLFADAIVHRSVRSEAQHLTVRDWRRALLELRATTQEFNQDGIPVPIEGLKMLAAYIDVAAESDDEDAKLFSRRLRELANANESFEHTKRELADFSRWSPTGNLKIRVKSCHSAVG